MTVYRKAKPLFVVINPWNIFCDANPYLFGRPRIDFVDVEFAYSFGNSPKRSIRAELKFDGLSEALRYAIDELCIIVENNGYKPTNAESFHLRHNCAAGIFWSGQCKVDGRVENTNQTFKIVFRVNGWRHGGLRYVKQVFNFDHKAYANEQQRKRRK